MLGYAWAFARVVSIYEKVGAIGTQGSRLLAAEPDSESDAVRSFDNYRNLRYKVDVHEVVFEQNFRLRGACSWNAAGDEAGSATHSAFGSNVHVLPGRNIFPSDPCATADDPQADPLVNLFANVGAYLTAEYEAHEKGEKPVDDELTLRALDASIEVLQRHSAKVRQVHLRYGLQDHLRWCSKTGDQRLRAKTIALKQAWTARQVALGLDW